LELKIFCIGDSRTGTTSLHYFLKAAGFKSIHHYEWVTQRPGVSSADEERDAVLAFIMESSYEAFTDYPTRSYYKEITNVFPDALIINTTRSEKSLAASASKYFGFDDKETTEWIDAHFAKEAEIESYFRDSPQYKYLAVNICEDGDSLNLLKDFLGLNHLTTLKIGKENQSKNQTGLGWLDGLTSQSQMQLGYYKLFSPPLGSNLLGTVEYLEQCCKPGKSLPSESSHHYLINDASHSIRQYLGLSSPDQKIVTASTGHFDDLASACQDVSAHYKVFSIPEKYSIYPEFLPACLVENFLEDITVAISNHPSRQIGGSRPYFVHTASHLLKKKSYGDLYFHGDTHLSSIGFHHALKLINAIMLSELGISLDDIPDTFNAPVLGSWLGDLAVQLPEDLRSYFNLCFSHNKNLSIDNSSGFKNISYIIYYPPNTPSHVNEEPYLGYSDKFLSLNRPKTTYTNPLAPISKKILVFRDSTATYILPSLTLLYQQVISIWDRARELRRDIILDEQPDFVIVITADRFICSWQ
jgi:hypothetical protein